MKKTDKSILTRLQADQRAVAAQIDKIRNAEVRRANAVHVGKYFKAVVSRDKITSYAQVTRMDERGMLYYNSFHRDNLGSAHFHVGVCGYHMQHWEKATPAEYRRAAKQITEYAALVVGG